MLSPAACFAFNCPHFKNKNKCRVEYGRPELHKDRHGISLGTDKVWKPSESFIGIPTSGDQSLNCPLVYFFPSEKSTKNF